LQSGLFARDMPRRKGRARSQSHGTVFARPPGGERELGDQETRTGEWGNFPGPPLSLFRSLSFPSPGRSRGFRGLLRLSGASGRAPSRGEAGSPCRRKADSNGRLGGPPRDCHACAPPNRCGPPERFATAFRSLARSASLLAGIWVRDRVPLREAGRSRACPEVDKKDPATCRPPPACASSAPGGGAPQPLELAPTPRARPCAASGPHGLHCPASQEARRGSACSRHSAGPPALAPRTHQGPGRVRNRGQSQTHVDRRDGEREPPGLQARRGQRERSRATPPRIGIDRSREVARGS
jgi:hypothetical protein